MAILYALVARGTTVLAEFSAASDNTGAVARRILEKLPAENGSRLCFSQYRYIFHILRSESITFLCMANDTFGRRIPFAYLEDIQTRFMKNYGKVAPYAPAYAMNDEFSRVLHQQMEFFSSNPSADTLNHVRSEVGEVRTIMVDNIEKILERGDRIELLVDKTSTMQDSAFHFKKQSKTLRRSLWMKNAKLLGSGGSGSGADASASWSTASSSSAGVPPTNNSKNYAVVAVLLTGLGALGWYLTSNDKKTEEPRDSTRKHNF